MSASVFDSASRRLVVLAALTCLFTGRGLAQYAPPADGSEWATVEPSDLGWNGSELANLLDWLEARDTRGFMVLSGGRIAVEAYFGGHDASAEWVWYSAGKSLMSVLVGVAVQEGMVGLEVPTSSYLGRWTLMTRVREDSILVWHQLTMTSGLDESGSFGCTLRICLQYRAPAGSRWVYHNAPYSLLRDVLEAASGEDLGDFTESRLGVVAGIRGRWESSGFNNFFHSTTRSAARFGLLVSRAGRWGTTALVDSAYVRALVTPSQDLNPSYGRLWWLNGQDGYIPPDDSVTHPGPIAPSAPPDVYTAAGAQGQFVSIAPSQDLVVVRMGRGDNDLVPLDMHDEIWRRVMAVVGSSTAAEAPGEAGELQLWPSPAGALVHLREAGADGHLRIYDILGRNTGVKAAMRRGSAALDVTGLSPGLYVVTLDRRNGTRTARTVIIR